MINSALLNFGRLLEQGQQGPFIELIFPLRGSECGHFQDAPPHALGEIGDEVGEKVTRRSNFACLRQFQGWCPIVLDS